MRRWIASHPVTAFLMWAAVLSWPAWAGVFLAREAGVPWTHPIVFGLLVPAAAGPSLASFLVSFAAGGVAGVRRLAGRFESAGFHPAWYAGAAILPLALAYAASLAADLLGGVLPAGTESVQARMLPALAWCLAAAFGQEFGWRGFLLPALGGRLRPALAGLAAGAVWGLWTLPAALIGFGNFGFFWTAVVLLLILGVVLPAHGVILAWFHHRTGGNLLIPIVFHFIFLATAMLLVSPRLYGLETAFYWLIYALFAVWGAAAAARMLAETPPVAPHAGDASTITDPSSVTPPDSPSER